MLVWYESCLTHALVLLIKVNLIVNIDEYSDIILFFWSCSFYFPIKIFADDADILTMGKDVAKQTIGYSIIL